MRPYHLLAAFIAVLILQGCASSRNGLVLEAVGPPPNLKPAIGTNGTLVVFSAFDAQAHFNSSEYRRYHTDYQILSEDGHLVRMVHNDFGGVTQEPKPVNLPPGRYRVVARANGYGWVTVPVFILANNTTTVHLEGGTVRPPAPDSARNSVRLPDGRIAGWRAQE